MVDFVKCKNGFQKIVYVNVTKDGRKIACPTQVQHFYPIKELFKQEKWWASVEIGTSKCTAAGHTVWNVTFLSNASGFVAAAFNDFVDDL